MALLAASTDAHLEEHSMNTRRLSTALLSAVVAVLALSALEGCVVRARPRPVVVRPAPVVVVR